MRGFNLFIFGIPIVFFFVSETCQGDVVINEVSDKGTYDACGGDGTEEGEDWIELLNTGTSDVALLNYILSDDKGVDDDKAKTFASESITAGSFLLLCKDTDFEFGIGGDDTVSLHDDSGTVISTTGEMLEEGSEELTYQRKPDGTYGYGIPTPDAKNIFDTDETSDESTAPTLSPEADCKQENALSKLLKQMLPLP